MGTQTSRAAREFFSPDRLFFFLGGSVSLGIAGNAGFALLTNWMGTDWWTVPLILVLSVGGLLLAVLLFSWSLAREPLTRPIWPGFAPRPHRGLILLVSRPAVCRKAIRYYGEALERCWLVCSADTLHDAEDLRKEFPAICQAKPALISDVNDPLEYFRVIGKIYRSLPPNWLPSQVIADYTGMTKHASVGMALACLRNGAPLQYTPAEKDQIDAKTPLNPIQIILDTESVGMTPGDLPPDKIPQP